MNYSCSEIINELEIGKEYTQKQLMILLVENDNITVISKSCNRFVDYSDSRYKVLTIIDGYEHSGDRTRTYHIPSKKSRIYIVD